jgi:hypothetical protein
MDTNIKLTEKLAVLATLDPASVAAGTVVSGWVKAADFHNIMALIQTGTLGASATVDAKLRQATDSSGTSAKDVANAAITQIVKASGDNKQAMIEIRTDELDSANGFGYVALSLTVGTASSVVGAAVIGGNPRVAPCNGLNQTAVVQVVAN